MATSSNYNINQVLQLTKSLVISHHPTAMSNNLEMVKRFGSFYKYNNDDFRTWKYYINMTGEYHDLDDYMYPDGIQVKVLETNTYQKLTKDLLDTYPVTKQAMQTQDLIYKEAVSKYPFSENLIHGITYPTTMDDIYQNEDGAILNYYKDAVEENEYNLIPELELFLKNYISRWSIAEYQLTDDLYSGGLITVLTPIIIGKIINIRLSNIGTDRVNSFYMNAFFDSNLQLSSDANMLPDDVKMWLYKNLKFLIKHTGKEENILIIIEEVMKKVGVDLREFVIKKNALLESSDNLKLIRYGDLNDVPNIVSLNDVLNIEFYERPITEDEMNTIKTPKYLVERTKLLSLDYIKTGKIFPLNRAILIFESWLYKIFNSDSKSDTVFKSFRDSNTGITYNLSEKVAGYLVIKWLFELYGYSDREVSIFTLQSIPRDTFETDNLISETSVVYDMRTMLNNAYEKLDYNNDIVTTLNSMIDFYDRTWTYLNDYDNPILRSDGNLILERIFAPVEVRISDSPMVIDDIFSDPIKYTTNYDYRKSIDDLIFVFTGFNIDRLGKINNMLEAFTNILLKLTSYTTQVSYSSNYPTLYITNEFNGDIKGPNLIKVKSAVSVAVEPLVYYSRLDARYNPDLAYELDPGIGLVTNISEPLPNIELAAIARDGMELPFDHNITIKYLEDYDDSISNTHFAYNLPATL